MKSNINPKILTWARERNGLSIDDLATKLNRESDQIKEWEKGTSSPSYSCLEDLAYRHLKLPLAVFFFPEPPELEDPKASFRRLPDFEISKLSSDTLQKIRLAQAFQESLAELMPREEGGKEIHHILAGHRFPPVRLAQRARKILGLTIKKQMSFQSSERAFKGWRHSLEQVGIFSFKDSLKDRFISGFALSESKNPIIFVNNSNAFSRQVFTLAHELGHILYGVNGVSDIDEEYIQLMSKRERDIEIKCNQFAAELLVPGDEFSKYIFRFKIERLELVPKLAKLFSVSRLVILRRLLDHNLISVKTYREKQSEWEKDYYRGKKETTGGNYYLTQLSYLGETFTRIAFENFHSGRISKSQLGTHLNINAKNLDSLESYIG